MIELTFLIFSVYTIWLNFTYSQEIFIFYNRLEFFTIGIIFILRINCTSYTNVPVLEFGNIGILVYGRAKPAVNQNLHYLQPLRSSTKISIL